MINWLQPNEWGRYYDNNYYPDYRRNRIVFSEREFTANISLCELQNIMTIPPISNPVDMSEPGICERWYGYINELLLWVTYYHTESKNYTIITCINPLFKGKYRWSFLEKLIDLPSPILQRISWIHGYNDDAEKSVYVIDSNGYSYEFYRAKSHEEATELVSFLQNLKSEYSYYIDEPEDFNSRN